MRILSIDFDYFLDTDIETREQKFPDGDENITPNWKYWCNKYPEINLIGVIDSYHKCLKFLKTQHPTIFLSASSHGDIGKIFEYIREGDTIDHYDFHHDNYCGNSKDITCANWVRILKDKFNDINILWHRREDSDLYALDGEYPYEMTLDDNYEGNYDIIFMCYSPEWTPPHLRSYFEDLVNSVINGGNK